MSHNPIIYDSDDDSQVIRIGASHKPNRRQPPTSPPQLTSSSPASKGDHNEPEPEQDHPPYNPLDHGVYDSYKDYDNILDFKDRNFRRYYADDGPNEENMPGLINHDEPPYRSGIDSGSLLFFLPPPSSNERHPEKSEGGETRISEAHPSNLQRLYDSLAATSTNCQISTHLHSARHEYPETSLNALGH